MAARRDPYRLLGPTAPRRRPPRRDGRSPVGALTSPGPGTPRAEQPVAAMGPLHPLTNRERNQWLWTYDNQVKSSFDKIVEVLKRISALQHEPDFEQKAQALALDSFGFSLPEEVLAKAWVTQLDMRSLFAWCVFETYKRTSEDFFASDPLGGQEDTAFDAFFQDCGFHLLDVSPCADGRLAHAISYALRLPFGSVRRRPYAGAMFDVERTVTRWIKTEHRRHREGVPNQAHEDTRYLKVVVYHFSSLDPHHQGCAAHGSNDALAAGSGLNRLHDFRQAVENSFCCGASVTLLLLGLDTDTDAIRIHVPTADGATNRNRWLDAREVYSQTVTMAPDAAREAIGERVRQEAGGAIEEGMVRFISRLLENNISQIDFVRQFHNGAYGDAGHAERFIGVGIGFKEIHLRNLTYFAHMETVEEGAADLDVGIRIFKGLNISRGLPVPVVIRHDFHSSVPGSRERAVCSCERLAAAVHGRYQDLSRQGLLHTLLTVRDGDHHKPPEVLGSSLRTPMEEAH